MLAPGSGGRCSGRRESRMAAGGDGDEEVDEEDEDEEDEEEMEKGKDEEGGACGSSCVGKSARNGASDDSFSSSNALEISALV